MPYVKLRYLLKPVNTDCRCAEEPAINENETC